MLRVTFGARCPSKNDFLWMEKLFRDLQIDMTKTVEDKAEDILVIANTSPKVKDFILDKISDSTISYC